ncbi:MAG: tRNA uridine-5-carboxymethylaminomethyl(34) synthesis GTPase MnmE [Gammaproteobacteria bacterium]|nr:tRNA uridine-5-carboxymethylaminomethyl(34) synthesis GTPase MnmE [Gammaproteobacteria bacterium]
MATQAMDTIAALATPPGRGGVGIVRVSGPACADIAQQILGKIPQPRSADYLAFRDKEGRVLDRGIALYFTAPNSFTGENVLELQGHGGPVVMDMLLQRVIALGARTARAGEFSERAFLNDKLDLAQAEAIADLIDCTSEQAARCAMRSLQGEFSQCIHDLVEQLTQLRVYVESAIDFPEEEIDFLADQQISEQVEQVLQALQQTLNSAQQGNVLREGLTVVIAGRPNVGKSTLLNLLTGQPSAIVTDSPGTTRDVLRQQIQIDGMPLHIIDTAGLRQSSNVVEQEGIRRAWEEVSRADRILYMLDASQGITTEDERLLTELHGAGPPVTLVYNKMDLITWKIADSNDAGLAENIITLSALSGTGVVQLRQHLKHCAGFQNIEGGFMARRRHLEALRRAQTSVESGYQQLTRFSAGELLAEELRLAQQSLVEITGDFTADDLLGKIFASFCIGK